MQRVDGWMDGWMIVYREDIKDHLHQLPENLSHHLWRNPQI